MSTGGQQNQGLQAPSGGMFGSQPQMPPNMGGRQNEQVMSPAMQQQAMQQEAVAGGQQNYGSPYIAQPGTMDIPPPGRLQSIREFMPQPQPGQGEIGIGDFMRDQIARPQPYSGGLLGVAQGMPSLQSPYGPQMPPQGGFQPGMGAPQGGQINPLQQFQMQVQQAMQPYEQALRNATESNPASGQINALQQQIQQSGGQPSPQQMQQMEQLQSQLQNDPNVMQARQAAQAAQAPFAQQHQQLRQQYDGSRGLLGVQQTAPGYTLPAQPQQPTLSPRVSLPPQPQQPTPPPRVSTAERLQSFASTSPQAQKFVDMYNKRQTQKSNLTTAAPPRSAQSLADQQSQMSSVPNELEKPAQQLRQQRMATGGLSALNRYQNRMR